MNIKIYCRKCSELLLKIEDRNGVIYGAQYGILHRTTIQCFNCGAYTPLSRHVVKIVKESYTTKEGGKKI